MTLLDRLRNRTARVRQHPWRMRPYVSNERHIIIGACPRSGTTLFRRIVDRHPAICCGPEVGVFLPVRFQVEPLAARSGLSQRELREMLGSSHSQGEFVDRFASRVRSIRGKARFAEKTPWNVRHFGWVLEHFPDARLIHVIRDGRDVVCSLEEAPDWRWSDGGWIKEVHPRPLEVHARSWVRHTGDGLRFRGDPRYLEVRYEDLVSHPRETVRVVTAFLDERFDEALLNADRDVDDVRSPDRGPVFIESVGRWQRDLSRANLAKVMPIMSDRLAELGYL